MHPRQKLRLLSLATLIPACSVLFYFSAKHQLRIFHIRAVSVYVAVVSGVGMAYMLRHREELRDPPEQRERQRQWALKNGRSVINLMIVIFALNVIVGAGLLYRGLLAGPRATTVQISLIASVPAIVLLLWVKVRLRIKGAKNDRGVSR
jgi:hypothetical protein